MWSNRDVEEGMWRQIDSGGCGVRRTASGGSRAEGGGASADGAGDAGGAGDLVVLVVLAGWSLVLVVLAREKQQLHFSSHLHGTAEIVGVPRCIRRIVHHSFSVPLLGWLNLPCQATILTTENRKCQTET